MKFDELLLDRIVKSVRKRRRTIPQIVEIVGGDIQVVCRHVDYACSEKLLKRNVRVDGNLKIEMTYHAN